MAVGIYTSEVGEDAVRSVRDKDRVVVGEERAIAPNKVEQVRHLLEVGRHARVVAQEMYVVEDEVDEGSRYFYTTPQRGIAASLQDLTRRFPGKFACEAWSKGMAGVSSPSFHPPAVGRPRTTLLSQDLLFDGPGGTSFLPGTILMQLNDHSHRGKEPAIMRLATHPTGF